MIDAREEQIRILSKHLKLPTVANYMDIIRQCKPDADFSDILLELLTAEVNSRRENQNRRRQRAAGFPYRKSLDDFDFTKLNKSVSPVFIHELASCKFIGEKKNIVMIGNPGRGKTHISIAIGMKACLLGYKVLFKNAAALSTELTEARDSYQLGKLERNLEKADLLILDELSYISFNKYTIVTTNLPFSRWTELFENNTMLSALVDRLTFRSHVLDMNGPSYRLLSAQSATSGKATVSNMEVVADE